MKTILVVENDDLIRKMIAARLRHDGFKTLNCVDGREAINMLEDSTFDLVITAIMLPHNNGLEVLAKVKELKGKNFPVIVLSKIDSENTIAESFRLGADDYMTRPFSPIELSHRVQRLLRD